jgi:uncharacterized membrane protein YGL010W
MLRRLALAIIASIFVHRLRPYALALFVIGGIFQFIGHAFEGKPVNKNGALESAL